MPDTRKIADAETSLDGFDAEQRLSDSMPSSTSTTDCHRSRFNYQFTYSGSSDADRPKRAIDADLPSRTSTLPRNTFRVSHVHIAPFIAPSMTTMFPVLTYDTGLIPRLNTSTVPMEDDGVQYVDSDGLPSDHSDTENVPTNDHTYDSEVPQPEPKLASIFEGLLDDTDAPTLE